MKSKTEKNDY